MRYLDDSFDYSFPSAPTPVPTLTATPSPIEDSAYWSLPYVPPPSNVPIVWSPPYVPPPPFGRSLDTGTQYPGLSTVGPNISVQPLAALTPGIPAGSLLAGARYSFSGSGSAYRRGSQYIPSQQGFSVAYQERLKRRKGRGLPF